MHRVMLIHRDSPTSRTSKDEASRGADFLSVSTFLKPQFRIAVSPTGLELQVKVEVRAAEARVRASTAQRRCH
jgi:hypothetical protein